MSTENFDVYFARAAALYRLQSVEHPPVQPMDSASSVGNHVGSGGQQSLRPPRRSVSCKYPAGNRRRLSPKECCRVRISGDAVDEQCQHTSTPVTAPIACSGTNAGPTSPRQQQDSPSSSTTSATALLPNAAGASDADLVVAAQTSARVGTYCAESAGSFDRTAAAPAGVSGTGSGPSSAAVGTTGHGSFVRRACSSAPHSRSSSWRKARRPNDSLQQQQSTTGVSLEADVIEKLRQLKLMQDDDYCVVRCFRTTPARGIVCRGDDQFRRLNVQVSNGSTGTVPTSDVNVNDTQQQLLLLQSNRPADDICIGITGSGHRKMQTTAHVTEVAVTGRRYTTEIHKVLVVGMANVGKTALLQQFMTSHYMAAVCTSFDDEFAKTVTVVLDGDEMTLDFVDVGTWSAPSAFQNGDDCSNSLGQVVVLDSETSCQRQTGVRSASCRQMHSAAFVAGNGSVDCAAEAYLVVYSTTDVVSFHYAVQVLCELRRRRWPISNEGGRNGSANQAAAGACPPVVILVGNKSDLVRTRQVSQNDAKCACKFLNCKYIEVSASLNHRVDELLVGIVRQIRLTRQRADMAASSAASKSRLRRAASPLSRHPSCSSATNVDCGTTSGLRRKRSSIRKNRSSSTSSYEAGLLSTDVDSSVSLQHQQQPPTHCSIGTGATATVGSTTTLSGSVGCQDGPAAVALSSIKAAKELLRELFTAAADSGCLLQSSALWSDTDCENLLEL